MEIIETKIYTKYITELLTDDQYKELQQYLVEFPKSGDVNMKDNDGKTALMYAVGREDYNTVKLLLDNGADVNMQNKYGRTALMYAVGREDYNTVKLLLDNGADVNMENNERNNS